MKQLLIVNSTATVPSGTVDFSTLKAGQLGTFDVSANKYLANLPTTNFGIVLGRKKGPAFVIPEVDVKSLNVTFANTTQSATAFVGKITVPTTVVKNANYTIVVVKKEVQFNERSNYTVTEFVPENSTLTANNIATKLVAQIQAMGNAGSLNVKAEASSNVITITGTVAGEQFTVKGGDALIGTESITTKAQPAIFDKAYIQDLASRCAADKGFEYTYKDGESIYPGYPEEVEDTTYGLITLRFAVGRASAKQRDEVVWQTVHIAVPTSKFDTFKVLFEPAAEVKAEPGAD